MADLKAVRNKLEARRIEEEEKSATMAVGTSIATAQGAKAVSIMRIKPFKSAQDISRVLENRYGNKSIITLEIIEDLQKIPV